MKDIIVYEKLVPLNLLFLRNKEAKYLTASKSAILLIRLFNLQNKVQVLKWQLADICDARGSLLIPKIHEELIELYDRVASRSGPPNRGKIKLFMIRKIQKRIEKRLFAINYLSVHKDREGFDNIFFHLSENRYLPYLSQYSKRKNVYLKGPEFGSFTGAIKSIFEIAYYSLFLPITQMAKTIVNLRKFKIERKSPLVATFYNLSDINWDKDKRSALFLFLESKLSPENMLVCFNRADVYCSEDMAKKMNDYGLKSIALSARATASRNVPVWSPTFGFVRVLFRKNVKLIASLFLSILSKGFGGVGNIVDLFELNYHYSFYYDFYSTLNIKIHNVVTWDRLAIPQSMAIKDLGGIFVQYQIANAPSPNITLSSAADVYFSFGPYFKDILLSSMSLQGILIYNGYITDYSFKAVKEKAKQTRQSLFGAEIKFVIAFFDESFGNQIFPAAKAKSIHDFFGRLILDHPDIAVIHKPKKTGFKTESKLLLEAMSTKRYIVWEKGRYLTDSFPSEVAQAADLSISLLFGGTVFLESVLAGVDSIFLDLEKLYYFDEYQFGLNQFVFDNLEDLKKRVLSIKNNAYSLEYPEKYLNILKNKDPFQDGRAIERIGDYLYWLFEGLKKGKSRASVLDSASAAYSEKWGKQYISL